MQQPVAPIITDELTVTLRIRHPNIDPNEISRALALTPEHCFRAGERRRTDEGEPVSGCYRESYWMGRFRDARPRLQGVARSEAVLRQAVLGISDTEAALTQALLQLQRCRAFLARLQQEGASVELLVETTVGTAEFAFSLSPRLLSMLTRCGVSLQLEVRAEPQPAARRLAG